MSKEVLVRYTQKFWGEEITTSYVKIIDNEADIISIYEALYEDPCVKKVEIIAMKGGGE